jgi:hypothetical protein
MIRDDGRKASTWRQATCNICNHIPVYSDHIRLYGLGSDESSTLTCLAPFQFQVIEVLGSRFLKTSEQDRFEIVIDVWYCLMMFDAAQALHCRQGHWSDGAHMDQSPNGIGCIGVVFVFYSIVFQSLFCLVEVQLQCLHWRGSENFVEARVAVLRCPHWD